MAELGVGQCDKDYICNIYLSKAKPGLVGGNVTFITSFRFGQ